MNFLRQLRALFRKEKLDSEMREEMRLHLEMQAERNRAGGMSADEAHYAAQRQFGNLASLQERAREGRGWVGLEGWGKDLRFALRRLYRTPTFTLTALVTLGLCIGANTAIFAVVDALVLRPLPFPAPERLVTVINSYPGSGFAHGGPSIPNYFERREGVAAFSGVAIFQPLAATVGGAGHMHHVEIARVTPEFFDVLGVRLAMGGMFGDDQLTYQTAGVAVITDEFWRSHFGADPAVIGKTFLADGLPSAVVGVLPPAFRFLSSRAQFFKPLAFNPPERGLTNRHNSMHGTMMVARLGPEATLVQAQAQLDALDARQARVDPKAPFLKEWGYRSIVRSLHADTVREVRPILLLLQAGVIVLLLVGAINLMNLLLVRMSGRAREIAVRQALGAGSGRLARESSLEIMLLAMGGGALGLGLGTAGVRLLSALGANQLPLGLTIAMDGRIAAIVFAATLVLGTALALGPLWFMRNLSLNAVLKADGAGASPGRAGQSLRQLFSMIQVALAFVLLSGAALLGYSLHRALAQPMGFSTEHLLTANMVLPWKGYPTGRHQAQFAFRLEQAMAALPGGVQFGISNDLPLSGSRGTPVAVEGHDPGGAGNVRVHDQSAVTASYWRTMGIPLLRGRLLGDEGYSPASPRVCVIDQAMADLYWPGDDPVGKRLAFGTSFQPAAAITVVGVVGTVKQGALTDTQPKGKIYLHYGQFPTGWLNGVMRGSLPPAEMAEMLRQTVAGIDPEMLITRMRTMDEIIDDSLLMRRSPAVLAAIFAGIALVLSAVGTYGVLASAVNQRRREIGVRMALGASPGQVVRLFMTLGTRLLMGGGVLGLFGAWATGQAMRSLLFEVSPFSPLILGAVAVLMGGVAVIAIIIPAARAARVDPCETLRHD